MSESKEEVEAQTEHNNQLEEKIDHGLGFEEGDQSRNSRGVDETPEANDGKSWPN